MTEDGGPEADRPRLEPWLVQLRSRLLAVAYRRVPREVAQDLAQDALQIILERGVRVGTFETVDGLPPLVWCLQVLRNVIGNYYQKNRVSQAHLEFGTQHGPGMW